MLIVPCRSRFPTMNDYAKYLKYDWMFLYICHFILNSSCFNFIIFLWTDKGFIYLHGLYIFVHQIIRILNYLTLKHLDFLSYWNNNDSINTHFNHCIMLHYCTQCLLPYVVSLHVMIIPVRCIFSMQFYDCMQC